MNRIMLVTQVIINSDKDLSLLRFPAILSSNDDLMLIKTLGTIFGAMWIKIQLFLYQDTRYNE